MIRQRARSESVKRLFASHRPAVGAGFPVLHYLFRDPAVQ